MELDELMKKRQWWRQVKKKGEKNEKQIGKW